MVPNPEGEAESVTVEAETQLAEGWIQTSCVEPFWPLKAEGTILIQDIAHHLALRNRFSGATEKPYSVAQHSVLVARECLFSFDPEIALMGLLHDAAEAYLPDIPRPIKDDVFLWCDDSTRSFAEVEDDIMQRVANQYGLCWPFPHAIKEADNRVCATERRDLMASDLDWDIMDRIHPCSFTIKPWKWQKAERKFLELFEELTA